jgi:hypothetical protein
MFWDRVFHSITEELSVNQLQWLSGDTGSVFNAWAEKNGFPVVVDEISENARLFWIGKQRTDRVILYFHGTYPVSIAIYPPRVYFLFYRRRIYVPYA